MSTQTVRSRLVNLFVKNVAAVDKAANRRTFLVVKAEKCEKCPYVGKSESCPECSMEKCGGDMASYESSDKPTNYADALFARQIHEVYSALGDRYGALMDTVSGIKHSSDIEDKPAAVREAVKDFVKSMQDSLPSMLSELSKSEEEIEKAGRKISAERLAKLKTALSTLDEIIKEQEEYDMSDVNKNTPDVGVLRNIASSLTAMFAKASGASDDVVTELERAAAGETEPVIAPAVTARLEKAETTAVAQAELLEKADKRIKDLENQIALRKFADEVSAYKGIGLDPKKDAEVLKAISENLPQELSDRVREIFKSMAAAAASSNLFEEVGSQGDGAPQPNSAVDELNKAVDGIVAKGAEGKSRSELEHEVFKSNPGLYDRWRAETTVKV